MLCLSALLASLLLLMVHPVSLTLGLILQGVARSSLMTVLVLTLVEMPTVGDKRAGVASGMFFSAAEMGGMLGPLGIGLIYDATHGFDLALAFLSLVAVLLLLGTARLRMLRGA